MSDEKDCTREEIDQTRGPVPLEFGAAWCSICQASAPGLAGLLERFPQVRHLKVEDGKGKRLGRSFGVKLWPNLVFLKDGKILRQLARPSLAETESGLKELTS